MNFRFQGLCTFAALFIADTASAETLVNIASTEAGDALYVDRDSMVKSGPAEMRRFPVVRIWGVNQIPAGRRTPARTERFLFSFNCTQRTSHILIYRNNRSGIKLQDWQAADLDYKYDYPRPGSLAEVAMIYACSGGRMPVMPAKPTEGETDVDEGE